MILGVSGWLGNKLGISEKVVRLGFVISVIFFGVGIAAYLILWVVKIVTE